MPSIIKIGSIDKRLILPIQFALSTIIINLFGTNNKFKNYSHPIIDLFTKSIGKMLIIIIPNIKKYSFIQDRIFSKKKFVLNFIILIMAYLIFYLLLIFCDNALKQKQDYRDIFKLSLISGLCSQDSFLIIFITLFTKFILKYNYFIHNIISIICFVIISILIDIILNPIDIETDFELIIFIFFAIFLLTTYAFIITYLKYFMDKLYFTPYNLAFITGISVLLLNIIFVIAFFNGLTIKDINIIKSFSDYFNGINIFYFILIIILNIFLNFLNELFQMLTIYYLTPNHLLISYIIIKLITIFFKNNNTFPFLKLIALILQFFILMIYLEVLELNFAI